MPQTTINWSGKINSLAGEMMMMTAPYKKTQRNTVNYKRKQILLPSSSS